MGSIEVEALGAIEAIEEGDKGKDDTIVHYITDAMMKQHTFKSTKK